MWAGDTDNVPDASQEEVVEQARLAHERLAEEIRLAEQAEGARLARDRLAEEIRLAEQAEEARSAELDWLFQKAELRKLNLSAVKDLINGLSHSSQYPGDVVGILGALVLISVMFLEETANRLTGEEFTTALIVFGILTIAGPLIALLAHRLGINAVVGVANSQAEAAANEATQLELEMRGILPRAADTGDA
jgi:hypothetical protein